MTDQSVGGLAGHPPHVADRRLQRELDRRGHVCSDRCVKRADAERHYDNFGGLIKARPSTWKWLALGVWTAGILAAVVAEAAMLFGG